MKEFLLKEVRIHVTARAIVKRATRAALIGVPLAQSGATSQVKLGDFVRVDMARIRR